MKKTLLTAIAIVLTLAVLCTGALAQGGGNAPQGNNQQQGGPQQGDNPPGDGMQGGNMQGDSQNGQMPGGGQPGGMSISVSAVEEAIATLSDEETAASLTALLVAYQNAAAGDEIQVQMEAQQALLDALTAAGLQIQNNMPAAGGMGGSQYGRFLDTGKVEEAIAVMTDTDAAANLTALLYAYKTAVQNGEQTAIREALQALVNAMNQVQVQETMQNREQWENMDSGSWLDTDAVATAIAALDDETAAASLTGLLESFIESAALGNQQVTQAVFDALMQALAQAGIEI